MRIVDKDKGWCEGKCELRTGGLSFLCSFLFFQFMSVGLCELGGTSFRPMLDDQVPARDVVLFTSCPPVVLRLKFVYGRTGPKNSLVLKCLAGEVAGTSLSSRCEVQLSLSHNILLSFTSSVFYFLSCILFRI